MSGSSEVGDQKSTYCLQSLFWPLRFPGSHTTVKWYLADTGGIHPPNMASTQWPTTGLSAEVKQLITHFFSLVDLPKPDAGLQIAAEVFTEDGVFTGTGGSYKGRGTT